ncbi:MAG: UDP-glucose/GDP-mannose dehydrogenase family protein [Gammaproteobacteria bacterium]|nr:UDP-glucose/GDP-mannose dehydrogenase family protein [Gammaproteobacteria bacterium]MDE0279657.1 UDP-glucose/GDP-mannose dehydrogenase family protein [Gammaproteobacteria bacterium]MDE0713557.1 UDP-glucose/GDP-mannose dehydrogenase family protein [Gammaproteobacteria bacterium]MXY65685.1 UDP-glucose/GDP-mannose dehydrogenase family protein [Gammaproteobacteria bacterium]MYG67435.1 UDP-glucose/GDP-mannose dehydrogenase family protein [Gammaproteobacteria bacterium]
MNITVVGAGYVGLVTGACLADVGNHVVCVDTDRDKIDGLNRGIVPIHEPGLDQLVADNREAGRIRFTTDIARGVAHGEVIFIAVGTPPDEDGSADLAHVLEAARSVGEHMDGYRVVATKSTVPVGTAEQVRTVIGEALASRGHSVEFGMVSNPEFLKEGAAVDDFMKPDRIIIGSDDEGALEVMRSLYAPFNRNHERVIAMDIPSAELTKYTANAMLATKISFMNEMANLAERLGADIEAVRVGIGADPRIGYHFIYPGCGYGGSCFPKDVKALYHTAGVVGYEARILAAVEAVNNDQKRVLVNKLMGHFNGTLRGRTFALWGLSFKPDTNDMREAPSRVVIESLWEQGARVQAFDPLATAEARRIYGERDDLDLNDEDPYAVLEMADALIVVTEWRAFRAPDIDRIRDTMRGDAIFDGRNVFLPEAVRTAGLHYHGIGR